MKVEMIFVPQADIHSMGVRLKTKTSLDKRDVFSGEGGIRTREPLWVTRFPSVRAKPDYATSPVQAGELYQNINEGRAHRERVLERYFFFVSI